MAEVEQMMPPPPPLARLPARPHLLDTSGASSLEPLARSTMNATPIETEVQRAPKRADLHITTTTMASIWVDVRITHCAHAPSLTGHLRQQELQKRREYGHPNDLPAGICAGLRPFVIESRGRAASAAQELSSWLISQRVRTLQRTKTMAFAAALALASSEFWQPISVLLLRSWSRALVSQHHALVGHRA